jgi:hypothetical protein
MRRFFNPDAGLLRFSKKYQSQVLSDAGRLGVDAVIRPLGD